MGLSHDLSWYLIGVWWYHHFWVATFFPTFRRRARACPRQPSSAWTSRRWFRAQDVSGRRSWGERSRATQGGVDSSWICWWLSRGFFWEIPIQMPIADILGKVLNYSLLKAKLRFMGIKPSSEWGNFGYVHPDRGCQRYLKMMQNKLLIVLFWRIMTT